jgi:hypothetical protein
MSTNWTDYLESGDSIINIVTRLWAGQYRVRLPSCNKEFSNEGF